MAGILRPQDPRSRPGVIDGSHIKRDRSRHIARDIVQHHRERIKSTREFDPVWCFWFRRKREGRRCSCWAVEESPNGICGLCYGTGVVGGYDKWGFETQVIDVTSPNLMMVNVMPFVDSQIRPVPFCLAPNTTRGRIEYTLRLRKSYGVDQLIASYSAIEGESYVRLFVKTRTEDEYVELNRANLNDRLVGVAPIINLRVDLGRASVSTRTPIFSHLVLRHQTLNRSPLVPIDVPQQTHSVQLQELGVLDIHTSLQGWVTWEFGPFEVEDFLVNVGRLGEEQVDRLVRRIEEIDKLNGRAFDARQITTSPSRLFAQRGAFLNGLVADNRTTRKLKIIETTKDIRVGTLLSTTLQLRQVIPDESIDKVPV